MVNKRDKSIGTEAMIVMFVKENDVFVQQIIELHKEISNYLQESEILKHGKEKTIELFQGQ
jgi:hypothetical protein